MKFGDRCTCDPFSFCATDRDDDEPDDAIESDIVTNGIVMFDYATKWIDVFPKASKSTEHTIEAFTEWCGPKETVKELYTDNAPSLAKAARAKEMVDCQLLPQGTQQTTEQLNEKFEKSRTVAVPCYSNLDWTPLNGATKRPRRGASGEICAQMKRIARTPTRGGTACRSTA